MRLNQLGTLCVLSLSLLCLPGCWDYQRINDRAQIIGIAIDPVEGNPSLLSYTFQIPEIGDQGGGGGGGGQQPSPETSSSPGKSKNLTERSRDLLDAVGKAQTEYNKLFYLGNLQTIILNAQLTEPQIHRVVSELVRTPTVDKLSWVLASKLPARDIFESKTTAAPADDLDRILGVSLRQHGYAVRTRLWEFWRDSRSIGIDPVVGLVGQGEHQSAVGGVLAFRGLQPQLELPPEETIYFNMIYRGTKALTTWIQDGDRSFEITNLDSQSRIFTTRAGMSWTLHVRIRSNAILAQDENEGLSMVSDADMRHYESVMENQFQQNSLAVLKKFQEGHIDPFGFGENALLTNRAPEAFIKEEWPKVFSTANVDLKVDVNLLRKGSLM